MPSGERIDKERGSGVAVFEARTAHGRVAHDSRGRMSRPGGELSPQSPARVAAGAGGHLNHRSAWVLGIIGAQPGLSNKEIGEQAGGMGKGHICVLLRRLKGLGLIENMQQDPTPYVPNAWRLTNAGRVLERTVWHELPAPGQTRGRGRVAGTPQRESLRSSGSVNDPRRAQILSAFMRVVSKEGVQGASVERVLAGAKVSREVFDELFDGHDGVLLAAFDDALALAGARIEPFVAEDAWLERVRGGLLALLGLFDEQPALGRLLVVGSSEAGPLLRDRRASVLAGLARALDDERAPARRYPPLLAADAVVGGVLAVLAERLGRKDPGRLVDLANSLMSFIVLPFLGAGAARKELSRPAAAQALSSRKTALELLHGFSGRAMRHPLAPRVLAAIHAEPGLSNIEVARRAGVNDEGHMSRVLKRLTRLGLIENRADAPARTSANAWQLTRDGQELQRALRYDGRPATEAAPAATIAVWTTCAAIVRLRAALRRTSPRVQQSRPGQAFVRLVRLAAFGLPTPPLLLPTGPRALLVAVARWLYRLNKRWQASYSIPLGSVNREASGRYPSGHKQRRRGDHPSWQRDFFLSRTRSARCARGHVLVSSCPYTTCSTTAQVTISQALEVLPAPPRLSLPTPRV